MTERNNVLEISQKYENDSIRSRQVFFVCKMKLVHQSEYDWHNQE